MLRLVVLISGRGSNLGALIDYTAQAEVSAQIVKTIADRPAEGCKRAESANIPSQIIDPAPLDPDSDFDGDFETALAGAIDEAAADFICLAGFMRVLSAGFCARYAGKIINIHPSLLPAYKGLDTHARVLAAGEAVHGCSVHLVTAELDGGAVLARAQVEVRPDDNAESLAARVLAEEHILYPLVIGALVSGALRISPAGISHHPRTIPGRIEGADSPLRFEPHAPE